MKNVMNVESLYKNYGRMLMDISYRITQNQADAEEILQETFMELWKRKPVGAVVSWLKKVVVNKSLNLIRDRKSIAIENNPPKAPDGVLEDKEKIIVIKRALSHLKPLENTVVVLKRYHGMSHNEIANILGITDNNSRIILYRAMEKLKDELKLYF
ncbi:sigma-70 family RNA polymerase sigma factor [candidate division WOR-3 bacterium]|jgi:RNA polymerase sigma-70 factor (ECF subfamily)|nr:sigma-70 family RNA polymerase sigma factor [candidate division WOR-3 bacterium]